MVSSRRGTRFCAVMTTDSRMKGEEDKEEDKEEKEEKKEEEEEETL